MLEGVSFGAARGSTLGLVGESGSGKSTVGRAILKSSPPPLPTSPAQLCVKGREVVGASRSAMLPLRRHVQVVFQDPGGSLNPRMRVAELLAEPFVVHGLTPAQTAGPLAGRADLRRSPAARERGA